MTELESRASDLRRAFAAVAEVAGDGSRCAEPATLWASAREGLDFPVNEDLILHLGECGACAAAWRLARELTSPESARVAETPQPAPARPTSRWLPLVAAALLIVGLGALVVPRFASRPPDERVYRNQEERWLESELAVGVPLSREQCVLRWAAGPEETTYRVLVTSEELDPLARAVGLSEPRYRVAKEAFEGLEDGQSILWRVTAYLPDGRRVSSRTFVTPIR